jgi:hypothetical protein
MIFISFEAGLLLYNEYLTRRTVLLTQDIKGIGLEDIKQKSIDKKQCLMF